MESEYKNWLVYRDGLFFGTTQAISPEQAINNIRFRSFGLSESQHTDGCVWRAVDQAEVLKKKKFEEIEQQKKNAKSNFIDLQMDDRVEVLGERHKFHPVPYTNEPYEWADAIVNGTSGIVGYAEHEKDPYCFMAYSKMVKEKRSGNISIDEVMS